jgi:hypothetical protein
VQLKPAEERVVALMGASSGCAAKHGVDGLLELATTGAGR